MIGVSTVLEVPDRVDAQAADAAREALDDLPVEGDTLALVSGGHDSLTAMHIVAQSRRHDLDGIVHVNTGIGIPDTREFVRRRARELDVDYYEIGGPETPESDWNYRYQEESYVYLVREYGFPGPGAHKWMYINLKEKPLQRWLRQHYPDREVVLISGVSRHESDRRMQTVDATGLQEYLGCTTVSPLVEFRGIDVTRYRSGLGLSDNPVVRDLEMSGECLCGSFASRGELRMVKMAYPHVWRYIQCIEAKVWAASALESGPASKYKRWGHNRLDDREQTAMDDDDQMLLCASCKHRQQCDTGGNECTST